MDRFTMKVLGDSREIALQPGLNRLGRSPENDHTFEDPSVSRFHCELQVVDDSVFVQDLGAANGTFIDGQPVQQASVLPGQKLRLGSLELVLEAALPPDPAPPPRIHVAVRTVAAAPAEAAPAESAAAANTCVQHPDRPAAFICQKCRQHLCASCVKKLQSGMRFFYSCPSCSATCVSLDRPHPQLDADTCSYPALVAGAFTYPFRGDGAMLLFTGMLFFSALDGGLKVLVNAFVIVVVPAVLLLVISFGYLFNYMRNIAVTTVQGHDTIPGWPPVNGFGQDMVLPFFQFLTLWLVCLAPGLAALVWVHPLVGALLLLFGFFCVPMALLTVSLADGVGGLNPFVIFSSIGKAPGAYLLACAVFLLFMALSTGAQVVVNAIPVPVVPSLLLKLLMLYGLSVEMRIMGLFYRKYRDRLAWFNA